MRDEQSLVLEAPEAPARPAPKPVWSPPPPAAPRRRSSRRWLLGLGLLALLIAILGFGIWQHYRRYQTVMTAQQQHRANLPGVRVDAVRASADIQVVSLPATTLAFESANIFARASGYISKRTVDIGSPVKEGQLLAEITAPELDHQIAQAEGNLAQLEASLRQTEANRDLARVTSARSSALAPQGYASQQQADSDRLNYQALQQASAAAEASIAAQRAQVAVLQQQKAYQQVVAPFDGVITQRNIDVGSLVQADAASGTSLFSMDQSDVIRVQLYVPQDVAFGVKPGVDAVIHVPEIPDRGFPGKVTRIADALQPGTRTLLTEIDVPNPDGALQPGVYCTVELHVPRRTPSLMVPASAVIFNQQGLQTAVVENGVVHFHKLTVVRDLGTEVEVSDGVKNDDKVVLNPSIDLADGSPVEVLDGPISASP
ncbi:MAG TPA: efflux RND transporter periplasmic adaptor subunit [Stellaceae bacterium]|nr:efflux RND transporter periplasmic adaptor subunit [Stellaceae bacterium]